MESGPVTCDTHCYSSAHSHPPLDQYLAAHTDSHSIETKGSPNQSQTVAVIGMSNSVTGVGNTGMGVNGSGMEFGDTEMQAGGIGTGGNGSQMNAIGMKSNGGFESMVQESDQAVPTLTPVKIEPELIRSKELVFQCGTEVHVVYIHRSRLASSFTVLMCSLHQTYSPMRDTLSVCMYVHTVDSQIFTSDVY